MSIKSLHAHHGGINLFRLDFANDIGKRTGVIHLRMVGNNDVDFGGVADHRGDSLIHLLLERSLDGINQRNLIRKDKIRIVCRSSCGLVTVKLLESPVNCTDPPDFIRDLYGFQMAFHDSETCPVFKVELRRDMPGLRLILLHTSKARECCSTRGQSFPFSRRHKIPRTALLRV